MSSPNPFAAAIDETAFTETPQYQSVPCFPFVVYRRGTAAFQLNPYSWEHAYLTGHFGTPTARTTFTRGGVVTQVDGDSDWGSVGTPSTITSEPIHGEAEDDNRHLGQGGLRVFAHLLPSIGDVPAPVVLKSMGGLQGMVKRGRMEETTLPEIAKSIVAKEEVASPDTFAVASDSRHIQGSASGVGEWDNEVEAESPRNTLIGQQIPRPFPISPLNRREPEVGEAHDPAEAAVYVAELAEQNHRQHFSPYNLRKRGRYAVAHQIEVQIQVAGMPFDDFILRQAGIKRFNPAVPIPTPIDLLYDCGSATGRGITISQFGRVFKCCM